MSLISSDEKTFVIVTEITQMLRKLNITTLGRVARTGQQGVRALAGRV